jgi:hypothetical protein
LALACAPRCFSASLINHYAPGERFPSGFWSPLASAH